MNNIKKDFLVVLIVLMALTFLSGCGSEIKNGFVRENNHVYYYINGEMKTGWVKINNNGYYMNSKGEMQIGWQKINEEWYYFLENGEQVKDCLQIIDGERYIFNEKGIAKKTLYCTKVFGGQTYNFHLINLLPLKFANEGREWTLESIQSMELKLKRNDLHLIVTGVVRNDSYSIQQERMKCIVKTKDINGITFSSEDVASINSLNEGEKTYIAFDLDNICLSGGDYDIAFGLWW